jgi:hypothetical protein
LLLIGILMINTIVPAPVFDKLFYGSGAKAWEPSLGASAPCETYAAHIEYSAENDGYLVQLIEK